jgi:predicted metalloprotease with PDZ domain
VTKSLAARHKGMSQDLRSILKRCLMFCLLTSMTGFALGQCRFTTKSKPQTVTYRFQPEVTAEGLVLHVKLEFRSGSDGLDHLIVPADWAGEKLHGVTNLRTVSKHVRIEDEPDASTKIIHARANRDVVIGYDLSKDWTGLLVHPLQFHAILQPKYFEFTGSNALVRLQLQDGATETANFDWNGLPIAWTLATSFGASESVATRCQTYTGPWKNVEQGLYSGGDYRIHPFQIGNQQAVLAVRGDWTFTDDDAAAQIAKVVGMVRDFWHDDNFPYFLVTLTPYDQDHGSSDGSAFTNAFWMYVSRKDTLSGLLPQLAHESFHAWNPGKMGHIVGAADEETKWFKEGFTDYYGYLLTYRAGALPIAKYIDFLNRDLRSFPDSMNEYVRGAVIALWLDGTIRSESNGQHTLDDVMFDMVRSADKPYTLTQILETAGQYLSGDSRGLLERAVSHQGNLPAPEHAPLVGDCAQATLQDLPGFDLGFDLERSRSAHVIRGVEEAGPAYAVGMRDGQPLYGSSFYTGNTERLAKFKVGIDGTDKEIEFYPRGKSVAVWQYRINETRVCERLP